MDPVKIKLKSNPYTEVNIQICDSSYDIGQNPNDLLLNCSAALIRSHDVSWLVYTAYTSLWTISSLTTVRALVPKLPCAKGLHNYIYTHCL